VGSNLQHRSTTKKNATGMGITFTKARISNQRQPRRRAIGLEFLIDTGAIFSVVPDSIVRRLALTKLDREEFTLADGTRRAYDVGEAFFELGGRRGTSKVVFGPPNVTPLLGALTLESLGLMVNPVTREVSPMRLFLGSSRSGGAAVDSLHRPIPSVMPLGL
jgi:aspartyl protease family protein